MDVIEGMRTFAAVAEARSFTAAAETLNMSKALASKYVGQLEDRLGLKLLNRDTRNVSLTGAGQAYLERCNRLLDEFDALENSIRAQQSANIGRIRLSAPSLFAATSLVRQISDFLDKNPDVGVDVSFAEGPLNLAEDGFDLALCFGETAEPSRGARQLASVEIAACASPQYLDTHGRPRLPCELTGHSCIIDRTVSASSDWTFHREGEANTVCVNGRIKVSCTHTVRKFLLTGAGIGLCPEGFVRKDIGSGHLEKLFADYTIGKRYVHVVYPRNRKSAPNIDVFVDFLAKSFNLVGESE